MENYSHLKLGGIFTNEALEVLVKCKEALESHAVLQLSRRILTKGFPELSVGFEEASADTLHVIDYQGKLNLPID